MWLSFQKYTWWKLEQPFCVQVLSSEAKDREPCLPRKYKAPKRCWETKMWLWAKEGEGGAKRLVPWFILCLFYTEKQVGGFSTGCFFFNWRPQILDCLSFFFIGQMLELLQLETSEHFPHLLEKLEHQVDLAWVPRLVVKVRQSLQKNGRVKKKTNIHAKHFLDFLYFHLENAL